MTRIHAAVASFGLGAWLAGLLLGGVVAGLLPDSLHSALASPVDEAAPVAASSASAADASAPVHEGADRLEAVRQAGRLRVLTLADNPPFAFASPLADGPVGFDVDLAHALGNQLDLTVEIITVDDPGTIRDLLLRNEADVAIASVALPAFVPAFELSTPYLLGEVGVMVLARLDDAAVRTPRDLNGTHPGGSGTPFVVGVLRGHPAAYAAAEKLPDASLRTFGEPIDAIRALHAGEVDAFAHDAPWLASYRHAHDADGVHTRLLAAPLLEMPYRVVVRPRQPAMMAVINDTLNGLERDGTLGNLRERYLESQAWRGEYGVPFRDADEPISARFEWLSVVFAIGAVIVLGIVFVLLIVWHNRAHRRQLDEEEAQAVAARAQVAP